MARLFGVLIGGGMGLLLVAAPACIGDLDDYNCEHLDICDGQDLSAQTACTGTEVQEIDCGVCGAMSRTCQGSHFGLWTSCTDPRPGCNPCQEPTWESPIDNLMVRLCNRCHPECQTYTGIMPWVRDGSLEWWTVQNHFIYGDNKATLLRWIDIGAPQTTCDVPYP